MKNKLGTLIAATAIAVTSATTMTAQKLYPVQGPLAVSAPQTVYTGHLKFRVVSGHVPFYLLKSWTVAKGEVLTGNVTTVNKAPMNTAPLGSPAGYPPQSDLAVAWDAVFGQGYFVARVLGNSVGQGIFKGPQGTVLQVESLDGQKGVAIDNRGNVYKMVW
jgi:hypothetical protein